jgi:hypothetical protein
LALRSEFDEYVILRCVLILLSAGVKWKGKAISRGLKSSVYVFGDFRGWFIDRTEIYISSAQSSSAKFHLLDNHLTLIFTSVSFLQLGFCLLWVRTLAELHRPGVM